MLQIDIDATMDLVKNHNGLMCKFGIARGRSMRMIQELLLLKTQLHGFNTFTGLSLQWSSLSAGAFCTNDDIPNIEDELYFHRGLFWDSIPAFLALSEIQTQAQTQTPQWEPLAFANIDTLLYGSTQGILLE